MNHSTLFVLILLCLATQLKGNRIHVGKQYPNKSISSAIAKANSGDTILIHEGNYSEGNIKVDKALVITGLNFPVVSGAGKYEIFTVAANNVTITGLKLVSSGKSSLTDLAAIKLQRVSGATISGNILENNYFGIYLAGSSECKISGNKIRGNGQTQQESGNGIHLWKCNKILIEQNESRGHRDGIYFEFVTESSIIKNTSENNLRYGLHFMFSDNDKYEYNTFRNNGAGVAVMYTKNVRMYKNHFELNWGSGAYAILLKDIRDSEIKDNVFSGNTTGIYAESVSRVVIQNNTFSKNGWALRLTSSCDAVKITGNNFIGNTFDMASNTVASMTENSYDGNYWDKYEGYDLNKDKKGDVPYYPVSLSTMLVEKNNTTAYFLHSFVLELINQSEKVIPSLIPEGIRDNVPSMKKFHLL